MTRRFPLCLAVAACLALPGCATVMGDVRPFDRVAPSPYDTHPAMAAQAHVTKAKSKRRCMRKPPVWSADTTCTARPCTTF